MQTVHDGKAEGVVSGHSLLETYAILTRLPRVPRITPLEASALITENIVKHFAVVALTGKEYGELARKSGQNGTVGGSTYDLLHLACAEKAKADRIYTFNVHHFAQLAGHLGDKITAP